MRRGPAPASGGTALRLREGLAALGRLPALATTVAVLGAAGTITAGTWIAGVPALVRDALHAGAGGFSLVTAGYAAGSIAPRTVFAAAALALPP